MSRTFQSLSQHNYKLWFAGNVLASSGQWMQRVAQDWLVLTVLTAGGGFELGLVTALQFAPILLFSAWAGVLADRMDRRHLLQITQTITALTGLAMGVLVLTGTIQLWMVYLLAFIGGTASAFDNPVRQAFVSELVPSRMLPNAVALNSTAFNSARLIGPALSGVVIDAVGPGWVFIVNAALFLVPVLTLALMRPGELHIPPKSPRQKGQLREGLSYVRGRKDIILILVVMGLVSCFGLNFQITSALMATQVFNLPAGGYGLMSTFLAVGAVSGSLAVARHNNPRLRLIVGAALLFGTVLGALALSPNYTSFLILAIPTGIIQMVLITSANAAVQMSTEPKFRGRVMAIYSMIFMGTTPIGAPIIGWIGQNWGARWSIGIGAVVSIVTALFAALWGFFVWKIRLQWSGHSLRPHLVVPGAPPVPGSGEITPLDPDSSRSVNTAELRQEDANLPGEGGFGSLAEQIEIENEDEELAN